MTQERLFSNQRLIKLIIPLAIEQGLTILVGMCDGVMVSSVGEAAIFGVSLVDMINAVILNLFAALATGGAVVTSQFLEPARENGPERAQASWCSCPALSAHLPWRCVKCLPWGLCGFSSAPLQRMSWQQALLTCGLPL